MRHDSGLNDDNKGVVHRMLDKGYNSTSIACYIGVDQARVEAEKRNYEDSKPVSYIETAKKALGLAQ